MKRFIQVIGFICLALGSLHWSLSCVSYQSSRQNQLFGRKISKSFNLNRVEITQPKDIFLEEYDGFYYMTNILFNDQPVFKNNYGKYLFLNNSKYKASWVVHSVEPKEDSGYEAYPYIVDKTIATKTFDLNRSENKYLLKFYDELKDEWKRKIIKEGIPEYKLTAQNSPSVINPWNRSNGVFQQDHLIQHDRKIIKIFDSSPDLVSVHPSAQYCPGLLPVNAIRVSVSISIDGNYEGRDGSYLYSTPKASIWRGTGLYASAGEKIYVKVPKSIVKMGANIQIGSHIDSDHAYNMESIRRFPYITDSWSIDQTTMEMTSAFGGLVYITIPSGSKLGNFNVTIRGAGRAPRYIHGETTQDEWRSIVRKYPAPWAELESDMVILTIPSSEIRDLDDPGRVMDFWKRAMDGANYLAARKTHTRPERYVVDPNWDWGAHAGYPMMIAGPWSQYLIDIDNIGLNFWWGTFHELGHNFQLSEWTWNGWTEVSCNLWATYILETIAGLKREETWDGGNLMPERRKKRIENYIKYGPGGDAKPNLQDFNGKLLKDPALGFEVLLLLQESFGWDFYKKINGEYLSISKDQEPKSDQEKIQDFIFISSKIAGVNLIDYYRDWGFPIDPKTERALTHLPNWAENPLKQYIHPLSLN